MSSITTANDSGGASNGSEIWSADPGSIETMTSKREAVAGSKVRIADGISLLVAGQGKLELVSVRPCSARAGA